MVDIKHYPVKIINKEDIKKMKDKLLKEVEDIFIFSRILFETPSDTMKDYRANPEYRNLKGQYKEKLSSIVGPLHSQIKKLEDLMNTNPQYKNDPTTIEKIRGLKLTMAKKAAPVRAWFTGELNKFHTKTYGHAPERLVATQQKHASIAGGTRLPHGTTKSPEEYVKMLKKYKKPALAAAGLYAAYRLTKPKPQYEEE